MLTAGAACGPHADTARLRLRSVHKTKVALLVLVVALIASACGDERGAPDGAEAGARDDWAASFERPFTGADAYPLIANSEIVVGRNRMLVGLLDDRDRPIGSPRIDVDLDFFHLERRTSKPVSSTATRFVWTIEPTQGIYVGEGRFDSPGKWGAVVTITGEGMDEKLKTSFEVKRSSSTPAIGARPPASETPTLDDVDHLSTITTDPRPDRRFYRVSVADAVGAGKPAVIVFATPKFCSSRVCGPTLDVVKGVAGGFRDVNFVHVEVYELPADPSDLQPVPAVERWGLPSEPWVFVLDEEGRVAAKYEGTVGPAELRAELEELV